MEYMKGSAWYVGESEIVSGELENRGCRQYNTPTTPLFNSTHGGIAGMLLTKKKCLARS